MKNLIIPFVIILFGAIGAFYPLRFMIETGGGIENFKSIAFSNWESPKTIYTFQITNKEDSVFYFNIYYRKYYKILRYDAEKGSELVREGLKNGPAYFDPDSTIISYDSTMLKIDFNRITPLKAGTTEIVIQLPCEERMILLSIIESNNKLIVQKISP